jgi:cytochrome P450
MTGIPDTDVDLFTDEALSDPYPLYQELLALGPTVRLTANEMYAFPQYREVREASGDGDVFSSAKGVMMNAELNAKLVSDLVGLGDAGHDRMLDWTARRSTRRAR